MASNIKATSQKEDVPEKETPETEPDSPLLDLSDAAVKKLIRSAKKRGYVTHDQINSVLSSEEVNSDFPNGKTKFIRPSVVRASALCPPHVVAGNGL